MEAWYLVELVLEGGGLDALESFPPWLEDWIQQCSSSVAASHQD